MLNLPIANVTPVTLRPSPWRVKICTINARIRMARSHLEGLHNDLAFAVAEAEADAMRKRNAVAWNLLLESVAPGTTGEPSVEQDEPAFNSTEAHDRMCETDWDKAA